MDWNDALAAEREMRAVECQRCSTMAREENVFDGALQVGGSNREEHVSRNRRGLPSNVNISSVESTSGREMHQKLNQ